jgi:oxalate decarboxylase/phosphoglucose isomerase-like protein (cupin superfamily)
MRTTELKFEPGFRVAFDIRQLQAAEMVIAPGESEGGPGNRHRGADQWLFVVGGEGVAVVQPAGGDRREIALRPGTLLVIERGEAHEIRNDGNAPLQTVNFYSPPAFDRDGNPVGPGQD